MQWPPLCFHLYSRKAAGVSIKLEIYWSWFCTLRAPSPQNSGAFRFRSVPRKFRMNPAAKTRNKLRHRLNVASGSPEIHDAKTQSVLAGDHSIGKERLAAFFYGFQQSSVQFVQIFFRLLRPVRNPKFL